MSVDVQRRKAPVAGRIAIAAAAALAAFALTPARSSAATGGLLVIPRPAANRSLSYFKLQARPGTVLSAGTIELRNNGPRTLAVAVGAVDGLTLSTLGSGYAPPGSARHGASRWILGRARTVRLAPHAHAEVPVTVQVPANAGPGDYLAGVSVEAQGQNPPRASKGSVSVVSVSRYAIGVEISLPGPRTELLRFTGAAVRREPAGLAFTLQAGNFGNVILQGVHGAVRVSSAGRPILARTIEGGTFVTHSGIAYPVTAFGTQPAQGTRYRVQAWLRYRGGIARLDTLVTYGHAQAALAAIYAKRPAHRGGGTAWWMIAGAVAVLLYSLATTALLLRRRRGVPLAGPAAEAQERASDDEEVRVG